MGQRPKLNVFQKMMGLGNNRKSTLSIIARILFRISCASRVDEAHLATCGMP